MKERVAYILAGLSGAFFAYSTFTAIAFVFFGYETSGLRFLASIICGGLFGVSAFIISDNDIFL